MKEFEGKIGGSRYSISCDRRTFCSIPGKGNFSTKMIKMGKKKEANYTCCIQRFLTKSAAVAKVLLMKEQQGKTDKNPANYLRYCLD